MPELPEVETIVRQLADQILGWRVHEVQLARGDVLHGATTLLCAALSQRRVAAVTRQGKQIHLAFDGEHGLIVHLGMTGRLLLADRDDPPELHTHLRIAFQRRRRELRYVDPRRFGGLWLVANGDARDVPANGPWMGRRLPPVGVDALAITLSRLRETLAARRQLKALLLDQATIGGLGNIYCDEALWRARLHPQRVASTLTRDETRRLHRAIRTTLDAAIRAGGSTISDYRTAGNQPGQFQTQHRVYDRTHQPCPRCRAPIHHLTAAGRSTFLCPACQPAP